MAIQREIGERFRDTLRLTPAQRLEADRTIAETRSIDRQVAGLGLELGLGHAVRMDRADASAFVAVTSTGAYHGVSAQGWLGGELARELRIDRADADDVRLAAGLVARHIESALGFFARLGPVATGRIPSHLLAQRDRDLFDEAAPLFAAGLAAASTTDGLAFSGAELINENRFEPNDYLSGYALFDDWGQAELLLLASGYDERFLIDAVAASLRSRPLQRTYWADLLSDDGVLTQADPRVTALRAAALNAVGPALVAALAARSELDLLIEAQFGSGVPLADTSGGDSGWLPAHRVLVSAASDRDLGRLVVSHVAARTADLPLDLSVANGVSGLMAHGLLDHVSRARRTDFQAAFAHVLESGAGLDVEGAGVAAIQDDLRAQFRDGRSTGNQGELVDFVGDLQAMGDDHLANDAAARDRAVDNATWLVGSGLGGAGLAATVAGANPVGLAVGLLGLGLSLWAPGSDREAARRETEFDEYQISGVQRQHEIAIALVMSGRVHTRSGHPLSLAVSPLESSFGFLDRYQVIDDVIGRVEYEGNFVLEDTGPEQLGELVPADRFNQFIYLTRSGETTTMGQVIKNYMYSDVIRTNRFDD